MRSSRFPRPDLSPMTGVFLRRTQKHRGGDRSEASMSLTIPGALRSWKRQERIPSGALQGSTHANTSMAGFWSPELRRRQISVVLSHKFVVSYSSPRTWQMGTIRKEARGRSLKMGPGTSYIPNQLCCYPFPHGRKHGE